VRGLRIAETKLQCGRRAVATVYSPGGTSRSTSNLRRDPRVNTKRIRRGRFMLFCVPYDGRMVNSNY
jgi:hypothetical protein